VPVFGDHGEVPHQPQVQIRGRRRLRHAAILAVVMLRMHCLGWNTVRPPILRR
jgi:hypothetical protein